MTKKAAAIKKEVELEATEPPSFDPISLLIGPMTEASFQERFYEQAPLFLKATPERKAFADGIFDMEVLCQVALEREKDEEDEEDEEGDDEAEDEEDEEDDGPLLFSHDLTARQYKDGEVIIADEDEFATEVTLRSLFNQGYTFQVCSILMHPSIVIHVEIFTLRLSTMSARPSAVVLLRIILSTPSSSCAS